MQNGIAEKRSPRFAIRDFSVFGERCSGTNFVQALISANLNLPHASDYGWKHGFPHAMGYRPDSLIVVVFRHPFDWVRSVYARPWHAVDALKEMSFSDFIRAPWLSWLDEESFVSGPNNRSLAHQPLLLDRHPLTGHPFRNLLALRRAKTIGFLSFEHRAANVVWLNYEHVAAQPQALLHQIAERFDLTCKADFTPPPSGLGTRFPWGARPKPQAISDEDHRFILSQLDRDQEARIGYQLQESTK